MKFIKKIIMSLSDFFVLWLGQSVSMFGSSMTGFAITIWVYGKTGSALILSVSSLLIMVPKMITGVFAGPFIDRANKKVLMVCADLGAGLCTLTLFLLLKFEALEIWHIYGLNIISSVLGGFQSPASDTAFSAIVPKKYYVKANGLQSFSSGTIQVLSPVFAAALLGTIGMAGIILIDFLTMVFACFTLIVFVKIPKIYSGDNIRFSLRSYINELGMGFEIIKSSILLRRLMSFMVYINLVAGITYFNLLSPMILARSNNDTQALAFVNGAIGFGSIVGAVLVLVLPTAKRKIKAIFLCAALSFFFGDILIGTGSNIVVWVIAGFLASVFLPAINAHENYFWRTLIPIELQGRAFSLKYALQSGVIPVGLILGGFLADFVFEPLMSEPTKLLAFAFGSSKGSGMALMFFITGIIGTVLSVFGLFSRSLQDAEYELDSDS